MIQYNTHFCYLTISAIGGVIDLTGICDSREQVPVGQAG